MSTTPYLEDLDDATLGRRPWYVSAKEMIHNYPLGATGGLIVLVMVTLAVFANFIAPYEPEAAAFEYIA